MTDTEEILMPWNDAVRLVAREAAREVIGPALNEHQKNCPIRTDIKITFWKILFLMATAGAFGGGAGAAVARAIFAGSP